MALTDDKGKPVPGFEKAVFGPISDKYLNQPQAVEFTRKQGMIPPSLLEAIAVRAYSGDPKAWQFQKTRLGAFCFPCKGEVFVAFDDIPDPKKNLVIARAQEGYKLNNSTPHKEFIVLGKTLREVLERAENDQRVLAVPKNGYFGASVAEYGTHPCFVAAEGHMALVNAWLIQSEHRDEGHLTLPTPKYVLEHVKEGEALALPVGLGADFNVIYCVSAINFDDVGLVRGISGAREFSEYMKLMKPAEK